MLRHDSADVVLALAAAPIDPRTGNRVLYSANWAATNNSMIGEINPDWVRRELDWFRSGEDSLAFMEGPVPKLFQACAGTDGKVNSAYGHILFGHGDKLPEPPTLFERVVNTFLGEGKSTRHAVAIISDRDVHELAHYRGRNDFICTNALNFMIDDSNQVHVVAQMRSMDAVFGYRADYSMWDWTLNELVARLNSVYFETGDTPVTRGDITFQVANLHVYPRHFGLLAEWADVVYDRQEAQARSIWAKNAHDPIFSDIDELGSGIGTEPTA